eukprot:2121768-Rhodomonas_salina.1
MHASCELAAAAAAVGRGPVGVQQCAQVRAAVHCEIKDKKTRSQYTWYQECVFLDLISGCRLWIARQRRASLTASARRGGELQRLLSKACCPHKRPRPDEARFHCVQRTVKFAGAWMSDCRMWGRGEDGEMEEE